MQLATLFGISENELTKLARRGEVPRIPNPDYPREWLYPLGPAVTAYTQYQRKDQAKAQQEYLVARTRAQMATAAKKELEIAVRNGTLIEKQKVIRALDSPSSVGRSFSRSGVMPVTRRKPATTAFTGSFWEPG